MIQHTIELTEAGYRLVIWEPAPKTTTRVNPYFFKATYMLSSPSKAPEILNIVKGETEAAFSQASLNTINQQTGQESCNSLPTKLPVAF